MLDRSTGAPFVRFGNLQLGYLAEFAEDKITEFDIRAQGIGTHAGRLSGGNQQKVVIARELSRDLRLFVAAQPTRGLDVGSIEFVHTRIVATRDAGIPVIVVSTELDEVVALADRIAVMYRGRIVGIVPGDTPRDVLGLMMAGETPTRGGRMSDQQLPEQGRTPDTESIEPGQTPAARPEELQPEAPSRRRASPARCGRSPPAAPRSRCSPSSSPSWSAPCSSPSPTRASRPRPDTSSPARATPSARSGTPSPARTSPCSKGSVYNFRRPGFANGIRPFIATLTFATPLIAAGLGVAIGFRAGLFNIGGRGQMLIARGDRRLGRLLLRPAGRHPPRRRPRRPAWSAARSGADWPDFLQGHDRRARGDHHDHAQLHRVLLDRLPAAHTRGCCRRRGRTTRSRRR